MSAGSKFHSCGEETEKPFRLIVPSDIEGPGVEPGMTTEGCALRNVIHGVAELDQVLRCTASQAVACDELSLYRIRNGIGSQ